MGPGLLRFTDKENNQVDPPDHHIPPILADARSMYVHDVGTMANGHPYLVLRSRARSRSDVIELIITVTTSHPARWEFGYVIKDPQTKTSQTFHGPYGDPTKDTPGRLVGFE